MLSVCCRTDAPIYENCQRISNRPMTLLGTLLTSHRRFDPSLWMCTEIRFDTNSDAGSSDVRLSTRYTFQLRVFKASHWPCIGRERMTLALLACKDSGCEFVTGNSMNSTQKVWLEDDILQSVRILPVSANSLELKYA